jgi:hypothetical protein
MGRQVNFYMTAEDEREFVAFVRSDRDVRVFKSVSPSTEISFLDELPPVGEPFWFALCLWDRRLSAPELSHIEQQGYYAVKETESEVIQFHRCGLDEGRLVRGRIWAEMEYWDLSRNPPHRVRKSESFRRWFDRLANWVKRHSVRDERGDYILPGAAKFAKEGGKLVQAVFAESVRWRHHDVNDQN